MITVSGPCPECGFMVESFYTATGCDYTFYALIMTCINCGESFNLYHECDCIPLPGEILNAIWKIASDKGWSDIDVVAHIMEKYINHQNDVDKLLGELTP